MTEPNYLRLQMAKKNIKSITELSDKVGLHANTLYSIDKGELSNKRISVFLKLADYFGCEVGDLLKGMKR